MRKYYQELTRKIIISSELKQEYSVIPKGIFLEKLKVKMHEKYYNIFDKFLILKIFQKTPLRN